MFGWLAFVVGQIVGELPWMLISTTIYFVLWYFVAFTPGLMTDASHAGGMWVSLVVSPSSLVSFPCVEKHKSHVYLLL